VTRVDEAELPCGRCAGVNGAHWLTCPTLRLPFWMRRGWTRLGVPRDQLDRAYGAYGPQTHQPGVVSRG
jgi:hypothetical protein